MKTPIILIGPVGAGKSTIGNLLSKRLSIPSACLDDERWEIYSELGYEFKHADELMKNKGFLELYKYWKPFEASSVEIIVDKYMNHIIDFGAGQSVYEDEKLFGKVSSVLEPIRNVVLLLPSPEVSESLDILYQRTNFEHNELFVKNRSNEKLAKLIVYTKGKTPEETCDEIINKLSR